MNKYIFPAILGILTLGFILNTYLALKTNKRLERIERQYAITPSMIPIQTPTNTIPIDLENAHTWSVNSICDDKAGYELRYQLEDGTNIYQLDDGTFMRARKVTCTNAE
jgi:hypothetical protein